MVIAVGPDGCHQCGMVDGVVVGKLRQRKQFDPVVLLVVAKGSYGLLYCLVLPLGLTVHLRVEGGREAVIETQVGANSVPKSAAELFAAIGGDIVQFSSFSDHVFEVHSCPLWGVNVLSAGEADRHFSQSVDDCQDPGVSPCHLLWQVGNKIQGKSLSGTARR
jgi:hypothetical protein